MSSLRAKRLAASLTAASAVVGASLALGGPANASVGPANCPTNGITILTEYNGHNCYAGYGNPPSGVFGIHLNSPIWISSNWNHGYSNYYALYSYSCGVNPCTEQLDETVSYQANGVQNYYQDTPEYAYSVVISG